MKLFVIVLCSVMVHVRSRTIKCDINGQNIIIKCNHKQPRHQPQQDLPDHLGAFYGCYNGDAPMYYNRFTTTTPYVNLLIHFKYENLQGSSIAFEGDERLYSTITNLRICFVDRMGLYNSPFEHVSWKSINYGYELLDDAKRYGSNTTWPKLSHTFMADKALVVVNGPTMDDMNDITLLRFKRDKGWSWIQRTMYDDPDHCFGSESTICVTMPMHKPKGGFKDNLWFINFFYTKYGVEPPMRLTKNEDTSATLCFKLKFVGICFNDKQPFDPEEIFYISRAWQTRDTVYITHLP